MIAKHPNWCIRWSQAGLGQEDGRSRAVGCPFSEMPAAIKSQSYARSNGHTSIDDAVTEEAELSDQSV